MFLTGVLSVREFVSLCVQNLRVITSHHPFFLLRVVLLLSLIASPRWGHPGASLMVRLARLYCHTVLLCFATPRFSFFFLPRMSNLSSFFEALSGSGPDGSALPR